jgi:hypothetical protein
MTRKYSSRFVYPNRDHKKVSSKSTKTRNETISRFVFRVKISLPLVAPHGEALRLLQDMADIREQVRIKTNLLSTDLSQYLSRTGASNSNVSNRAKLVKVSEGHPGITLNTLQGRLV